MSRKSKDEINSEIVQESLKLFDSSYKSQQEIRLKCLQDRRFVFVDGAMWEDALRLQFDNKPRFEINKLHMSCVRIFNEYRNNRVSVDFRPNSEDASDNTASTLNGLYRADEARNGGTEAYDNAFEEGVAGGFGAWRLRNVYSDEYDEDDDSQKIVFEPIYDADSSVFWSLDGKRYDKSDATHCWVITSMSREEYADKYGTTDPAVDAYAVAGQGTPITFRRIVKMTEFDWYTPDVVYVAEYYRKEEANEKIHIFRLLNQNQKDLKVKDADLDDDYREELEAQGYTHIRTRTVKRSRVHKWIHDGGRVLDDCGIIAGPCIPIVPFYGKRAFIDNQERIMGHIRLGKDAQRLYNMQVSLLAIISALSPRQKPIMTPEQVKGHEMTWANDNIDDNPYLLINPVTDSDGREQPMGPVGQTQPPAVPQALAAVIELTNTDLQHVLGDQEAGEQLVSNVSAKAVDLVQSKIDMQAFIYMDNFGKSMQRSGEIWLGMAKEIYDENNRRMTTIGKDGKRGEVRLNKPKMVNGVFDSSANDLRQGKYEVTVDVGPAFKSKRDATVRALVGMLQFIQDPQLSAIVVSLALSNMDGEGLEDLREFLRMQLVQQGVVKPTEQEQQQMQAKQQAAENQPPDAQTQYLMAAAQSEQTKATKHQADTIKILADSANSRADAIAKLANAKTEHVKAAWEILQTLISQTGEDAVAAQQAAPAQDQASAQPAQQAPQTPMQ